MNFQQLKYFMTIVQEKSNITRASEILHVSQQSLSNMIGRMEEELGCRLFERKPGLELTYSGRIFLESAEKILDISKQASSAIEDANSNIRGELRIGISHTRGQAILPLLLPSFSRKHPQAELFVVEGNTSELEEDLQKGTIDVLIGFAPFMLECAEYFELMKEHLFLAIPDSLLRERFGDAADSILAKQEKEADIRVFKDFPFVLLHEGDRIRTIVEKEFRRCSIKPEIKLETRNIQTAFALASEGMGLTIYPELYLNNPYVASGIPSSPVRRNMHVCRLESGDFQDTIAIGYNKERYLSNMARDFIDMSLAKFKTQPPLKTS